jgi:hypothetical protein
VKPEINFLRMEEMRAELKRQVAELGGVNEFCRQRGIEHHASVSLAMSGARSVTEAVANAAGFVSETVFRKF